MCGISIFINPDSKVNIDLLKKMNDKVFYRGPDGEGFYINDEVGIGFGHRRLSIIDLSENGKQPMKFGEKYVITYNGEIYNYIELREELISAGYQFSTASDTEVILASYDHWGKTCVQKFNGMWAFCIYDIVNGIVLMCRDRFGVKPLYYTHCDNLFLAGSEIKQLLEYDKVPREANMEVLLNYLVMGLEEQDHHTFFNNIYSLPPSHYLIYNIDEKKYQISKYYDLNILPDVRNLSESDAISGYHDLLHNSIKLRLRSDVKVGTCLSGGMDSSYIASVASEMYQTSNNSKFIGITASSLDEKNNELIWAKAVADESDLEWHVVEPSRQDFLSKIDEIIVSQEEPFGTPSIFMQYFVMKKSAELGCTVLLDGQGGDETLLGYERYYFAHLNSLPLYKKLKAFVSISNNSRLSILSTIKMYFYFNHFPLRKMLLKYRNRNIKKSFMKNVNWDHLKEISDAFENVDICQKLEITKTCLPHLLKYEDKNSMKNSIETRLPFLDYRLVEYAFSINPELKIKNGWTKYILRKSAQEKLPEKVVWRKNKIGFESPDKIWLADTKSMLNVINESQILKLITNYIPDFQSDYIKLWKYYNIAKWEKIYQVKVK
jgi:asparagine synthase (glutamine-hydrolysing)